MDDGCGDGGPRVPPLILAQSRKCNWRRTIPFPDPHVLKVLSSSSTASTTRTTTFFSSGFTPALISLAPKLPPSPSLLGSLL